MTSSYFSYLLELRGHLLRMVSVVLVVFVLLSFVANHLFLWLAKPLLQHGAFGAASLIATQVSAPLLVPLKFAFYVALFLCMPYLFYEFWSFVMPALYPNERRFVWPLLLSSTVLFYVGVLFSYFLVIPLVMRFFLHISPQQILFMPDTVHYLSFNIRLFFAFGMGFETPVLIVLLLLAEVCTPDYLKQARPYVFVLAFVVGMFLTPPDIISQTLLAVPLWLLFETGLWVGCKILAIKKKRMTKSAQ